MNKIGTHTIPIVLSLLLLLNAFVWHTIAASVPDESTSLHFLDVGQGDSELLSLPDNVTILTDAGPDNAVTRSIAQILPPTRHYIDIGIITHPQRDHYGGFSALLDHYSFGAIIMNGREADNRSKAWSDLMGKLQKEKVPQIILQKGDRIRHGRASIEFLSPNSSFANSKELNDTGFVERVQTPGFSALLTADIGKKVEQFLTKNPASIIADILKVGHHGSKFSSSKEFLRAIAPHAAVIEVGKNNTYHHPTEETLQRLAESGIKEVLRTDERGTVSMISKNGKLKIFTER